MSLFDEEERYRINVFDWDAAFPAIMKAGGFDAVIGNPPYVRQEALSASKSYFATHYEAFDGAADLYVYFLEKGMKLLRNGGLISYIVSSSFLRTTYGEPLRRTLTSRSAILRIVNFGGLPVFANAKDTYVCIPLFAKGGSQDRVELAKVRSLPVEKLDDFVAKSLFTLSHERFSADAWVLRSDEGATVFSSLMKVGKPLGEYVNRKFFSGVKTGLNEAFELSNSEASTLRASCPACEALIKPFLGGRDIRRYSIIDHGRNLIVIPCGWTRQKMLQEKNRSSGFSEREAWNWFSRNFSPVADRLARFAAPLQKRQDQGDYWWELRPCDYYSYFDALKSFFLISARDRGFTSIAPEFTCRTPRIAWRRMTCTSSASSTAGCSGSRSAISVFLSEFARASSDID